MLFDRDQSLELYLRPFLSSTHFTNARELAKPDSDALIPYGADGFHAGRKDGLYGSVNANLVYRWEYRPGSTFYLVWTHSRGLERPRDEMAAGREFDNSRGPRALFRNEPEDVLLAKVTYWFTL